MREHLFELSPVELKELYIHETKALVFALEAGVPWAELQYVRESIKDITRCIDATTPAEVHSIFKRSVEIIPPFSLSDNNNSDRPPVSY